MIIFEIRGIRSGLSMMRISYELTKRTTKNEKIEKSLKIYKIIKFTTVGYKLTDSALSYIQSSIENL